MSSAVAQNWSIHVKYASRQELYPEPNVFDSVAARDAIADCVAFRAMSPRFCGVAERDTVVRCVVVREFIVRGAVVV